MDEWSSQKLKEYIPINKRSEDERPREKLLTFGAETLTDSELMAILINNGTRNKSAIDLAKELLENYDNNLFELTKCEVESFKTLDGIGDAKATILAAAFELGKRIKIADLDIKDKITSPEKIGKYFIHKLASETVEKFYAVYLNTANKIIKEKQITSGILNASLVHPREVFKTAISLSANTIILVHNHPSGNTTPSKEDINITHQLVEAGKIIDIKILDHLIIAGNSFYSFNANGLLT
jgi:DNA repair protein RadC